MKLRLTQTGSRLGRLLGIGGMAAVVALSVASVAPAHAQTPPSTNQGARFSQSAPATASAGGSGQSSASSGGSGQLAARSGGNNRAFVSSSGGGGGTAQFAPSPGGGGALSTSLEPGRSTGTRRTRTPIRTPRRRS